MKNIILTLILFSLSAQANTWIRLGYVYTGDTKARFGSDPATVANMAAKHVFIQTAFRTSGTQTRIATLRVGRIQSSFGKAATTLEQMNNLMDNFREGVVWPYSLPNQRVRWGQANTGATFASNKRLDLICFVSPLSSGAGHAQIYGPCSLVRYNSPNGIWLHEIGHNFTLFHGTGGYVRNDEDAHLNDDDFYASDLSNNKRTALAGASPVYSIARFSNPNRTYSGYPYGTADRNNASIIRTTRTNVRSYRDAW